MGPRRKPRKKWMKRRLYKENMNRLLNAETVRRSMRLKALTGVRMMIFQCIEFFYFISNSMFSMLSLQIKAQDHYESKLIHGLEAQDRRNDEEGSNEVAQGFKLLDWEDSDDEYFSDGDFSQYDFDDGTAKNYVSLLSDHRTLYFVVLLYCLAYVLICFIFTIMIYRN